MLGAAVFILAASLSPTLAERRDLIESRLEQERVRA